jgi:hypothetical protein
MCEFILGYLCWKWSLRETRRKATDGLWKILRRPVNLTWYERCCPPYLWGVNNLPAESDIQLSSSLNVCWWPFCVSFTKRHRNYISYIFILQMRTRFKRHFSMLCNKSWGCISLLVSDFIWCLWAHFEQWDATSVPVAPTPILVVICWST